jgi:formyl-CoA transferase
MQVHGVTKVSAERAPELGEYSEEVLRHLGFQCDENDELRASGLVAKAREYLAAS